MGHLVFHFRSRARFPCPAFHSVIRLGAREPRPYGEWADAGDETEARVFRLCDLFLLDVF